MQVTIYLGSVLIEASGDRFGTARRSKETYREGLLVWASRYGFVPGVAVRLGMAERDALGLVQRIGLRPDKERGRVYRVADALAAGVVRFEGEARVVMVFELKPPAKGSPESGLRPRGLAAGTPSPRPEPGPADDEVAQLPEGPRGVAAAARA